MLKVVEERDTSDLSFSLIIIQKIFKLHNFQVLMGKFKEADDRLFKNVFVCQVCKKRVRADPKKVRAQKVRCPRCGSKALRPIHKDVKK